MIELEIEIKAEIVIQTGESKIEKLREVMKKNLRQFNTVREIKNKEMKKLIIEEIYQRV